ncbi:MAG: hypothetical protein JWP97_1612 [Labilithrix sp.]|nr:hypothetical protein [Labilithrix sp.]
MLVRSAASVALASLLAVAGVMGSVVTGGCSSFSSEGEPAEAGSDAAVVGSPDGTVVADGGALPAGLRYRWSFDDGARSTVGTPSLDFHLENGAELVPAGIHGKGLHCPRGAFADTFETDTPFEIGPTGATFVVWFKLDAVAGEPDAEIAPDEFLHTLFAHRLDWTAGGGSGPGYALGYRAGDNAQLSGARTDGQLRTWADAKGTIPNEYGWHMASMVAVGETVTLFIDGEKRASKTGGVPVSADEAGPVPFRLCAVGANPLRGTLDELMIFDRELAPAEVAALYALEGGP